MSRGNTGVRTIDLIYEVLRKHARQMTLTELSEATGVANNLLSQALSQAIVEGQPIVRVERGVYELVSQSNEIVAMNDDGTFVMADGHEEPPVKKNESGRIRRVRQRMKDLDSAMDDLARYMTKLEAKARAYDKIQLAMNGVVEDPL